MPMSACRLRTLRQTSMKEATRTLTITFGKVLRKWSTASGMTELPTDGMVQIDSRPVLCLRSCSENLEVSSRPTNDCCTFVIRASASSVGLIVRPCLRNSAKPTAFCRSAITRPIEGCEIPRASAPALMPPCRIAARKASIILCVTTPDDIMVPSFSWEPIYTRRQPSRHDVHSRRDPTLTTLSHAA